MSRKLLLNLVIHSPLFLPWIGCRSLNVHVGQSAPSSEVSEADSETLSPTHLYQSWNSMEDNVERLEELKKQGAQAFLDRYKTEGRKVLRSVFRQFRDSVSRNAQTEHNYGLSFFGSLKPGQCKLIQGSQDLFDMEDYGDLRPILQTAILAKLDSKDAGQLHPTLPSNLDSVTKLVFFELGIKLDGASHYGTSDQVDTLSSDMAWQVVHEQGEPTAWQEMDARSWRLSLNHQKTKDNVQSLRFEAQVGVGLYENQPSGNRDFLRFNYNQSAVEQSLELQNGQVINGTGESLVYSRRMALHKLANGPEQFRLIDTTRYLMAGSKTRSFVIDKVKGEICADTEVTLPEAPGSGKGPTPPPAPQPKPELPDNPSQNAKDDDPSQSKK